MRAVVIFESLWGNTARLGRAVGEGLGDGTRTSSTADATPGLLASADFLVLGAPVHSFGLPELASLEGVRKPGRGADGPIPDVESLLMEKWLELLPQGDLPAAVFETRIGTLEGLGGAPSILGALRAKGYRLVAPAECFQVERLPTSAGPGSLVLPEELERARHWGTHLATIVTGA